MRFLLFFLIFLFPFLAFAQEENTVSEPLQPILGPILPQCQDVISLTGPSQVKINSAHEFGIADNNGSVFPVGAMSIEYDQKNEQFALDGSGLNYSFSTPGVIRLIFTPHDTSTYTCAGAITKEVHVFREKIVYIGTDRADIADQSMAGIFREKSVLLEPIFLGNNSQIDDQKAIWNTVGNADIIVINNKNVTDLFPEMEQLQRVKEHNFANTKFFIISHHSRAFLAKILAKSVANLGIKKIFLISEDQLSTLLGKWSYEDNRGITLWDPLLYEKNNFSITMNHFLEYLAYSGVSYQFLGFLLLLSVVTLVYNILKQVVGLDIFTLYYPLLFAIIITQMWYIFSGMFAVIAIISVLLVRMLTKKLPLLINAKKAFLVSIYILLSLAVLGVDSMFDLNILDYTIFQNSVVIIGLVAILFIMERLLENIKIFSISGCMHIFRYICIVLIALAIFSWQDLKYFLISYPDTLFLIVIANLLVGRYTGLQVTEYFRFSPILKNLNEEE